MSPKSISVPTYNGDGISESFVTKFDNRTEEQVKIKKLKLDKQATILSEDQILNIFYTLSDLFGPESKTNQLQSNLE